MCAPGEGVGYQGSQSAAPESDLVGNMSDDNNFKYMVYIG